MNQTKKKKKGSLLAVSILLIVLGFFASIGSESLSGLLIVGIILLPISLAAQKNAKKASDNARTAQPAFSQSKPAPSVQQKPKNKPTREFSQPTRPAFVSEIHRPERNLGEHLPEQTQEFSFHQEVPHSHHPDLYRQARREISNLRNIRYARSELSEKTLSDTVLWHNSDGVCSSVVQVIRQGNLRYPDLSDKELSRRILEDSDLMTHLVRSLEWERSTELR